ncbi:lysylphosphatidylglycerol synthase domain-containing protein [Streptomyces sp. DSM 42041]|uniref:Lysylphosphatidylglycerol synthase domain-containing protein n=2 Tax=Streptomyces hazeniae TaxID=3075538 RepID=A0ABU2NM26_9ACTN|nr:lysylphosphatidylglycerol synthase domain-containing protein [Streptomyces sp. DSM 42041]MDT0378030.1 lysylphosphatidylglycerol synthase domain-containing protein [Streptomyces sp. DSM 42041]
MRDEHGSPGDAPRDGGGQDRGGREEDRRDAAARPDREPDDDAGTTQAPPGGSASADATGPADAAQWDGGIDEDVPLLPARVHRPSDLLRLGLGILGIVAVLTIAAFAHGTTSGLESDVEKGTQQAPALLISVTGLAASVAVLLVPVAFAIERLIKRDGLRIADGVLAAVLAHGVSLATDLWVTEAAPGSVEDALTKQLGDGVVSTPVHSYLAPVIAYMTAVGMARRPRWRVLLWAVLLLDAFAVLIAGYSTPFSLAVTVLVGWSVAYGTLYAVGSPNVRPTAQTLLAGLRRVGFRPEGAVGIEEPAPEGEHPDHERGRRYRVRLEDGSSLDVTVVDREQQAHGYFYRVWRRLALRGLTQPRSTQSLRQALEQEALIAYAAIAAGANAPRLIATSELGPDAVMLVYEHIDGRSIEALPDEEVDDDLMRATWRQVQALQSRRIAHRRLIGESLLVDRSGAVFLTDLRGGEIAAGDLVLRMDVAQLLTTFGLRVGAERSVAAAVAVLGPDVVADSLPLLQPIALSRSTRTTLRRLAKERAQREREAVLEASRLRKEAREAAEETYAIAHDRKALKAEKNAEKKALDEALEEAREEDLLAQIRSHVLLIRPQAPVEPARLERIRPRTLISFIAGALAAYFLFSQLSHVEIGQAVAGADYSWVAIALGFSALTYLAAAIALLGFVPEKVPFPRTVLAQIAGSFVKLVAPAAIGGVALNTRFLQKAGVRPGHAVASVGASQLFGLGANILLLLAFGYLTGTEHTPTLSPSRAVIAGLLAAAVLVLIVTAIPGLRKFVSERLRSLFAGVVPRMLDVVQRPKLLLTGVGGTLLLPFAFLMCLDASLRAFGYDDMSYATLAVVFLAGNALGSAAPTPGGLGAVEAALIAGLITFGVPKEIATPAVLLFRLMTFWLPVLPGWLSFTQLTRKGAL